METLATLSIAQCTLATYVFCSTDRDRNISFRFVLPSREFFTDFVEKLSRSTRGIHFALLFYRWNFRLPAYQRQYLIVRSRKNAHNSA